MIKKENSIKVSNISKSFYIPTKKNNGIKQLILNFLKNGNDYKKITPINKASFVVDRGDFFGIVGRNGSGKSTLLKLIAQIYKADKGKIDIHGKLIPFIELGVGFNNELTGRENVYLNGALLGFGRSEIDEMYNDIVDFAELGNFMEEQLKNYSSGMQVRLAFSIAIRARGDILLLDEVLAVGDSAFQRKCYAYFEDMKRAKKTVVLVTHDMGAVRRFCNKALYLEDGKIKKIGNPDDISDLYDEANRQSSSITSVIKEIELSNCKDVKINILDDKNKNTRTVKSEDFVFVDITWERDDVENIGVAIMRRDGTYMFGVNTFNFEKDLNKKILYKFKASFTEGDYYLKVVLFGANDKDVKQAVKHGPTFSIINSSRKEWGGMARVDYEWNL